MSNAFLHGDLHDNVFMMQPLGYRDKERPNHVCKLKRSLYGLRQAPRQWYAKFKEVLLQLHSSLFIYNDGKTKAYCLIYVDNILLTSNTTNFVTHIIGCLKEKFTVKELGPLDYFLGVEACHTPSGILLTQQKYV